ncbi:uncharacterized protein LOC144101899 [Amblyomma americanum]
MIYANAWNKRWWCVVPDNFARLFRGFKKKTKVFQVMQDTEMAYLCSSRTCFVLVPLSFWSKQVCLGRPSMQCLNGRPPRSRRWRNFWASAAVELLRDMKRGEPNGPKILFCLDLMGGSLEDSALGFRGWLSSYVNTTGAVFGVMMAAYQHNRSGEPCGSSDALFDTSGTPASTERMQVA